MGLCGCYYLITCVWPCLYKLFACAVCRKAKGIGKMGTGRTVRMIFVRRRTLQGLDYQNKSSSTSWEFQIYNKTSCWSSSCLRVIVLLQLLLSYCMCFAMSVEAIGLCGNKKLLVLKFVYVFCRAMRTVVAVQADCVIGIKKVSARPQLCKLPA